MAPVAIKFVVSFSSQDDHHKVQNLVGGDGFKKWLSHPKEKSRQIQAIFQLEEPSQLAYIDIGSQWCGSIEIKVGNSDWPQNMLYRTLVPTSSLMTPVECKMGQGIVKTRMFSTENFAPDVAAQKWDRVQVICRQPYRKDVQYGLSFMRIRAAGGKIKASEGNEEGPHLQLQDKTSSVASIQKHFFGSSLNKQSASPDVLKSRLMKLAGSSEGGVETDGALSRTAKLVLAASENAGKYSPQVRAGPSKSARASLFSEHLIQKYGSTFEEELCEFLSSIQMENIDLDKVTIADLRHKFEKKKKRKLSLDEKKVFLQQCGDHISSLFDANESKNSTQELPPLTSSEQREGDGSNTFSPKSYRKSTEKTHTAPSGCKRKLENESEFSRTPKSLRTHELKSNLHTTNLSKSTLLPQTTLISQVQKTFQQEDNLSNGRSPRIPFASKALNTSIGATDRNRTPKTRKRSRTDKEVVVDRVDTCDQWLSKDRGKISTSESVTSSSRAGSNPGTPRPSGSAETTRTKTTARLSGAPQSLGNRGSNSICEGNISRRLNQGSGYGGYVSCPSCKGNVPEHIFSQHARTCNTEQEWSTAAPTSPSRYTQAGVDDVYTVVDDSEDSDSADSDVVLTHDAESFVECPLCGDMYPSDVITVHADVCATAMEFA